VSCSAPGVRQDTEGAQGTEGPILFRVTVWV